MKKILIVLAVLIIALFAYSLSRPDSFKVERTIVIDAPVSQVWKQTAYFKNWKKWSPWAEKDSTVTNTYEGEDGTVGAVSSYTSKNSGSGTMTITGLKENKEITYTMQFIEPWESFSEGFIKLSEHENGTEVSWGFEGKHNFMSKFMNMDEMVGPDFERGLELLRNLVEAMPKEMEVKPLEVKRGIFPKTNFLMIKYNNISFDELKGKFYGENFGKLAETGLDFTENGNPSAIYFDWNEETKKSNMGVVMELKTIPKNIPTGFEILEIDETPSYYVDFYGMYKDLEQAHITIYKYFEANEIDPNKIAIEQYITDPSTSKNPSDWLTKVSYISK